MPWLARSLARSRRTEGVSGTEGHTTFTLARDLPHGPLACVFPFTSRGTRAIVRTVHRQPACREARPRGVFRARRIGSPPIPDEVADDSPP